MLKKAKKRCLTDEKVDLGITRTDLGNDAHEQVGALAVHKSTNDHDHN